MVRPTAGATPPPVPPPVQSVAAPLAAVPPPVQSAAGPTGVGSLAVASSPALPWRRRRRWRRSALAAALFVAAAFVAGRWSTMDEPVSWPTLDAALGQVPSVTTDEKTEEAQVVEAASSSLAPSRESSPEPADAVSAAPVASAAAVDVDDDVSSDIDAGDDDAGAIETSRDVQLDVAGAKAVPVDTTEISSKFKDEPNEPLSSLVAEAKPQAVCVAGQCKNDRKFGTSLTWAGTPDEAAKLATQQGKLVFVIQVSGNFAREEFT